MNWLLMITAVIFLGCIVIGVYRGAVRIAVSLVATAVTLVAVYFAAPYLANAIEKYTPLDDMIKSQVVTTMANAASGMLDGGSENAGMDADGVRKVLKAAGISEEQLEQYGVTVEDIVNGKVDSQDLARFGISKSVLDGLYGEEGKSMEEVISDADIPREVQIEAIEAADIPEVFKSLLSVNNNGEMYETLGVETFAEYVGSFLAKIIINIVAFLCAFIVITIVIRAIVFALDVVSNLPVLGWVNRLAGGLIGMVGALVIVWTIFVIITLLYTTSIGKEMYDMIQTDATLQTIYEYNPIMKLALLGTGNI